MKTLDPIVRLFTDNASLVNNFENQLRVEFISTSRQISIPSENKIEEEFQKLPIEDELTLDITIGSADTISLYRKTSKYSEFTLHLKKEISLLESDDTIQIKITIIKNRKLEGLIYMTQRHFGPSSSAKIFQAS